MDFIAGFAITESLKDSAREAGGEIPEMNCTLAPIVLNKELLNNRIDPH